MRLVDAEELEKATCGRCKESKDGKWSTDCLWIICKWGDVMPVIQKLPIVDAQPVKRGKWVEYSRNALETYIECTNCYITSRPIHLQMVTKNGSGLPDYCPNCGAKMDGDADETP